MHNALAVSAPRHCSDVHNVSCMRAKLYEKMCARYAGYTITGKSLSSVIQFIAVFHRRPGGSRKGGAPAQTICSASLKISNISSKTSRIRSSNSAGQL